MSPTHSELQIPPKPRAVKDKAVILYQAYNDGIAQAAVAGNSFREPMKAGLWKPTRMTRAQLFEKGFPGKSVAHNYGAIFNAFWATLGSSGVGHLAFQILGQSLKPQLWKAFCPKPTCSGAEPTQTRLSLEWLLGLEFCGCTPSC